MAIESLGDIYIFENILCFGILILFLLNYFGYKSCILTIIALCYILYVNAHAKFSDAPLYRFWYIMILESEF